MPKTLKLIFLFVATIIGAGFATGQEILQFFAKYGRLSYVGIWVSCALFGSIIFILLEKSSVNKLNPSRFSSLLSMLFCFVGFGIMASGFSNLLYEFANIPKILSCLGINIAAYLVSYNQRGIELASSIFAPLLILVVIMTCIGAKTSNTSSFSANISTILWSGLIYTSYNIISLVPLVKSLAIKTKRRDNIIIGAGVAIVLFTLCILIWRVVYNNLESALPAQIPMLHLANNKALYFLIIGCAILTTAFANYFIIKQKRKAAPLLLLLISLIMTFLPFSSVIEKGYSLFGYFGIIVIAELL